MGVFKLVEAAFEDSEDMCDVRCRPVVVVHVEVVLGFPDIQQRDEGVYRQCQGGYGTARPPRLRDDEEIGYPMKNPRGSGLYKVLITLFERQARE